MRSLSVIVAVLNEGQRVAARAAELVATDGVDEVVIVDGGSTDDTVAAAKSVPGARLLSSGRGRGRQFAHGARHASGEVLLFLHVDCRLPADAASRVREVLGRPGVVAGAFRTRHVFDGPHPRWLRPILPMADVRSHYSRLPYGDQALFVDARAYRACGGFSSISLFEDVDLAKRLWRVGRIEVVSDKVEVSARRYAAAPWRAALAMNVFPVLWRLGVTEERLSRWYGRPR